jgi:hypothetical protein
MECKQIFNIYAKTFNIAVANCQNKTSALLISGKSAITWQGSELYHFRAIVVENEFCSLKVEFAVSTVPFSFLYLLNFPP